VGDGLQATLLRTCATPIAHRVGSYKYKKHGPFKLLRPGSIASIQVAAPQQALALLLAHRRQGLGDVALVGGTLN